LVNERNLNMRRFPACVLQAGKEAVALNY
jgi:hypothetical protein